MEFGGILRLYVVITLKDSSARVFMYPFRVGVIEFIAWCRIVWLTHCLTSGTDENSSFSFALFV